MHVNYDKNTRETTYKVDVNCYKKEHNNTGLAHFFHVNLGPVTFGITRVVEEDECGAEIFDEILESALCQSNSNTGAHVGVRRPWLGIRV